MELLALHYFFQVFHIALILFNLFGWIHRATLRYNLVTLLLTAASWILLAPFYGLGYCPLTDWHYQVLWKLGHFDLPRSYIAYLVESVSGWRPPADLTDLFTGLLFGMALLACITRNILVSRGSKEVRTRGER